MRNQCRVGHTYRCVHNTRQIHGPVRFPWDTINDDKHKIWCRKQHTISVCYWLQPIHAALVVEMAKRHHTLNCESSIHNQRNRKTMHVKVMYAVRETTICTVTCTVCRGGWNPAPNNTRSSSQSILHREIMSAYRLCADVHVRDANMVYTQCCVRHVTWNACTHTRYIVMKCIHTNKCNSKTEHCCIIHAITFGGPVRSPPVALFFLAQRRRYALCIMTEW